MVEEAERLVALGALAESVGALDQLLGIGEPTLENRKHRANHDGEPPLCRLAQLGGQALLGCQVGADTR